MTKDISRLLLQTKKHYAGARLQQGRVLLDSDVNEAAHLGEEERRRALVDAIGPCGSPDQGFSLRKPIDIPGGDSDVLHFDDTIEGKSVAFNGGEAVHVVPLALRPGSMYAGGLRFDIDQAEPLVFQRDFLQMGMDDAPQMHAEDPGFQHLYVLHGWEQVVTPVEDQELREPMLRGPDTSVRIRRMRRVETFDASAIDPPICADAWAAFIEHVERTTATFDRGSNELKSNGRLQLVFTGGEAADTCSPVDPFGKRYLGAENQTLRIMLTSDVSYVWALDNASPLFKVQVSGVDVDAPANVTVTILNPPADERSWPFKNRVVEIIPFGAVIDGGGLSKPDPHFRKTAAQMGVFSRVLDNYDPITHSFNLERSTAVDTALRGLVHVWPEDHPDHLILQEPADANGDRFFYMRLWHDAPSAGDIELHASDQPGAPLGDTGITPVFAVPGNPGDYWVATLRTNAPAEIQPLDLLSLGGVPPHGPRHFYAPLTLIRAEGAGGTPPVAELKLLRDCRPRLRALTERCPTLTVGDGIHSFGDYTTIAEALLNLPTEGGIISVHPGVYAGPVSLVSRSNITIQGCGDATIIESEFAGGSGVIFIDSCKDITISSLRIHAGDEQGAFVHNESVNVVLDSLHVISGSIATGQFVPGASSSPLAPQVSVVTGTNINLNNLRLEPNRQIALNVGANEGAVSIRGLIATGMTGDDDGQNVTPLVLIGGAQGPVTLSESTLVGVGQVPLNVGRGGPVELSDLTVTSTARSSPLPFGTNLYPAAVIVGNHLSLRRSTLTMVNQPSLHAVVSLEGSTLTVEDCLIAVDNGAPALAWGGIHVLGGGSDFRILRNRIRGGYGHGITLGSVAWNPFNVHGTNRQEGPGQGQTDLSDPNVPAALGTIGTFQELDQTFVSTTEIEDIENIVIADNRIEGVGGNGISSITVTGQHNVTDEGTAPFTIFNIVGARIERNVIVNNLVAPSANVADTFPIPFPTAVPDVFPVPTPPAVVQDAVLTVPAIPFGGIVLCGLSNADIVENIIQGNGASIDTLPVNGIFILTGDSVTIESNRIAGNGARVVSAAGAVRCGVRAGVAVMVAGTASNLIDGGALDALLDGQPEVDNLAVALRLVRNDIRQPEGRALHVVGIGPIQIEGNFLASQGNQGGTLTSDGGTDITESFAIGDLVYLQNLGGPVERFGIDDFAGQTRFTTPAGTFDVLGDKIEGAPRNYLGAGGDIQFNNNHTVMDWNVTQPPSNGAPLSYFPVVLLGVDHVGMQSNHMAVRIQGDTSNFPHPFLPQDQDALLAAHAFQPVFSHILAAGITVNIQFNRMSENVRATFQSLMASADLMAMTTFNQSTHDTFTMRTIDDANGAYLLRDNQQVIYHVEPDAFTAVHDIMSSFLSIFLKLTSATNR